MCAASRSWRVAILRQKQRAVIPSREDHKGPRRWRYDHTNHLRDISPFVRSLAPLGMTRGGDYRSTQGRLMSVSSPRLEQICPSSDYRGRECARALYGSPFRRPLLPPIRSLPDPHWPLPHPVRDCKNQSRPARRRELQTRPCSSRNQETGSASAHPSRLFREYLSAPAIRFDTANDKDVAARTA